MKADDRQSVLGPATAAAAIARRPFLSGLSGRWVESQRDRLRRQLLRSLNVLSKTWLIEEQYVLAIEMATEAITIDPHRDASYQLLLSSRRRRQQVGGAQGLPQIERVPVLGPRHGAVSGHAGHLPSAPGLIQKRRLRSRLATGRLQDTTGSLRRLSRLIDRSRFRISVCASNCTMYFPANFEACLYGSRLTGLPSDR